MLLETHVGPDLPHRNCDDQVSHSHQIVGGAGEGGTSRIKRGDSHPLAAYTVDHAGVVINTPRFHRVLEDAIKEYAASLRKPESESAREAFRRKMNYICRIEEKEAEEEV
jgi:hypothetical protein